MNQHDAFFLARYAHNKLTPLLDFTHQSLEIRVGRMSGNGGWDVELSLYNWENQRKIVYPGPSGDDYGLYYIESQGDVDDLAAKITAENTRLALTAPVEVGG